MNNDRPCDSARSFKRYGHGHHGSSERFVYIRYTLTDASLLRLLPEFLYAFGGKLELYVALSQGVGDHIDSAGLAAHKPYHSSVFLGFLIKTLKKIILAEPSKKYASPHWLIS